MNIAFLGKNDPMRNIAKEHIRKVYYDVYGADVKTFAPTLVAATNMDGKIVCAAGIRTAADGFFSDIYTNNNLPDTIAAASGTKIPNAQIMEVVSLASTTPFPVLPMLDAIIAWGQDRNMACGVFTATHHLRHLLNHSNMPYLTLCPANRSSVNDPESWGSYYDTGPWVCALIQPKQTHKAYSPRALQHTRAIQVHSEAS
jgi:hypothetical protein